MPFSRVSTICRILVASRCWRSRARNGMRVLLLEVGERLGVGRVAGLVGAGLRHAELVEQHLLQLLRATRGSPRGRSRRTPSAAISAASRPRRALSSASTGRRHGDALAAPCARAPGSSGISMSRETSSEPGSSRPCRSSASRTTYQASVAGLTASVAGHELVRVGLRQRLAEVVVDQRREGVDLLRRAQQPGAEVAVEDRRRRARCPRRRAACPRASTRARTWARRTRATC